MRWILAFHIIFMVTWFGGLFYLPRLFVYHALATDEISIARFKVMERKLYFGIMTPGAVITTLLGLWLMALNVGAYAHAGWFHAKLMFVMLLWGFHLYCGHLRKIFRDNKNTHGDLFYRIVNEIPVVFLVAIVILVIIKPF